MSYDVIRQNYLRGLWTRRMVELAVEAGLITRGQADALYEEG